MSTFLVDYENVNQKGLSGISKLAENDVVYIFYSANVSTLTFDIHKQIIASNAQIKYISVANGTKNALDFQLDTFLGYLIATSTDRQFYIVSADNGFQVVKNFWSKTRCSALGSNAAEIVLISGITAYLQQNQNKSNNIDVDNAERNSERDSKDYAEIERIKALFASEGISDDNKKLIVELAVSSTDKQQFYTGMTKRFGMEDGLKYYKVLRTEYLNIRSI